jgi:hypothetical protein
MIINGVLEVQSNLQVDVNTLLQGTLTTQGLYTANGSILIPNGSYVEIDGTLNFKSVNFSNFSQSDNGQPIYLVKQNPASTFSILQLYIGNNGTSTPITTPTTGNTTYFAISTTNNGIQHLFGSDGSYTASGNVTINGNETIQGNLIIQGNSTLSNLDLTNETVSNNLVVNNNTTTYTLTTTNNATVNGNFAANGVSTLASLTVTGSSSLEGNTILGNSGTSTVKTFHSTLDDGNGNTIISGTLKAGNTTVSNLTNTGNETISGTLSAGDSTLSSLLVTGTLTSSGNTLLGNTSGSSVKTYHSILDDGSGNVTLANNSGSFVKTYHNTLDDGSGNVTITGTLNAGNTTVSELTINGNETVSGTFSAGNTTLANLNVTGNISTTQITVADNPISSMQVATKSYVDSNVSNLNTTISNITLQQVYNQTPIDSNSAAGITLTTNKNFRIYDDNNQTIFFDINSNTGTVTITGDLVVSGSSTTINSTITDEDHLLLSPASASTIALQINPNTTLTTNAIQVAVTSNGPSVFTVGPNGTTTISTLDVIGTLTSSGNTLLGNTSGSSVKTYHNTLDDGSGNVIITGTLNAGNTTVSNINISGNEIISGTLTAGNTTLSNLTVNNNETVSGSLTVNNGINGTILTSSQPNITSLGTLTGLSINGNETITGTLTARTTTLSSLTVTGNTLLASTSGSTVKTYHNTLDDGSGNVVINANETITGTLTVPTINNNTLNINGNLNGSFAITPAYCNWETYGTGAGGACIYNDDNSYKCLMIIGNTANGGSSRQVGVWDYLTINGGQTITGALIVNGGITTNNSNINAGNGTLTVGTINASTVTFSGATLNSLTVNGNGSISGTLSAGSTTLSSLTVNGNTSLNTVSASSINSNQFTGALNIPDFQYLQFGITGDNTDTIYFQRNNVATDVSMLQLVIGDNGSGTTVSTPTGGTNGTTDYFSIKAQDGIHHLWGTDGTYIAGGVISSLTSISAPNISGTTLTLSGNATISGTLNAGNTTLSSLTVNGNESVSGTLNAGNITVSGLTVNGNESVSGTLNAGNTTLSSLSVTGNETVSGSLTVGNGITGTILTSSQPNITSLGTLTGLNISGSLSASNTTVSNLTVNGNGSISGTLNVSNINTNGITLTGFSAPQGIPVYTDNVANPPIGTSTEVHFGFAKFGATFLPLVAQGNYNYLNFAKYKYNVSSVLSNGSTLDPTQGFDGSLTSGIFVPISKLPYTLTITTKDGSAIDATDVIYFAILSWQGWSNAQDSGGALTSWTFEIFDLTTNSWLTVVNRNGVNDTFPIYIPVYTSAASNFGVNYCCYTLFSGIRLTIKGATSPSWSSGNVVLTEVQLVTTRGVQPWNAVAALSQGGGTVYGGLNVLDSVSMQNGLTVSGNVSLGNTITTGLTVNGNTTISGTLNTGATTVSNLNDTGNATISGTLNAGNTTVSGLIVNGNESISGSLTINGNTLLGNASGSTVKTYHNILDDGSGNVTITGNLTVSGASTIINSTVTDEDHLLLSPASASTIALQINPNTTLTTNAIQVAVTNNGPSVFTVGPNGTTTITTLTTTSNTLLGNASGSTVKTYHNTLDDSSGNASIAGTLSVSGTINGNISGNATTASSLQNTVTIATSGDVSGSASFNGSSNITIPLTLANSGVAAGTYGSSTNIPQITVDSKGRITSATNVAVSIPSGSINVTGPDLTMSGSTGSNITNATLSPSGVTAGTYNNSATAITPFTVDSKGRITSVGSNITITPSWSSITNTPTTLSGYGITDAAPISNPTFSGTVTIPTLNITGNATVSGSLSAGSTVLNNLTINGNQVVNGTLTLQQTIEKTTVSSSGASGTITYYLLSQAILYYTGTSTGNWTLNITGTNGVTLNSVMAIGQTITCVFLVTNGSTPYYQTGLQIDGTAITPKWFGGVAPTSGNVNATDVYSFTIIKTANATFTVLESLTTFR